MNYSMYATFTGLLSLFCEKHVRFCDFNECVTDRPTDRQTDTAYYRDARTHLKIVEEYPSQYPH